MIKALELSEEYIPSVMTPDEILALQWNEFEIEARLLNDMLKQRDNSAALQAELKVLWSTKGGDTASYEQHQQELNRLIVEAWKLPTMLD